MASFFKFCIAFSAVAMATAAPGGCPGGTRPVISVDFNDHKIGASYGSGDLQRDFDTSATNGHFSGTKIVQGYSGAGLQISYPSGCVGSGCTLWFATSLPSTEEVYVSFRVKFNGNFRFNKGGKLPGVCGGDCNTGFARSSGYDGFSSRLMWREGGRVVGYAYHPGQPEQYGEDYDWGTSVDADEWVRLSQRVVLNDAGKKNGVLQGWIGNSRAYSRSDISWRRTDSLKVETFQFVTFFGGDDRSWAPGSLQTAVFDDILVCV